MKRLCCCILSIFLIIIFISCDKSVPGHENIEISNDSLVTTFTRNDDNGDRIYVLNVVSKKYHLKSCDYAIKMNEANRYETSSMHYIMERGYEPCKICLG